MRHRTAGEWGALTLQGSNTNRQDIVMLDSVHNDVGRWRLLGIRERVRLMQEWITWETRQDISDAKDERRQKPGCGNHNMNSSNLITI